MLKVLVADENLEANLNCCQFLANDKNIDVISASSGIKTLNKYHENQPHILVINSDFDDIRYTEIINELSATSQERKNCNIILTVKNNTRKLELDFMSKIYKLFYYPINYDEIKKGIEQFTLDNIIFYEPNEDNLRGLFYKLNLYNEHDGADYLKHAIIQCYNNPKLLRSLNGIFDLVSKDFRVSYGSVRPAMRTALKTVNDLRKKSENKGLFKLFENENSITPKNFIRIITTYYLKQKK